MSDIGDGHNCEQGFHALHLKFSNFCRYSWCRFCCASRSSSIIVISNRFFSDDSDAGRSNSYFNLALFEALILRSKRDLMDDNEFGMFSFSYRFGVFAFRASELLSSALIRRRVMLDCDSTSGFCSIPRPRSVASNFCLTVIGNSCLIGVLDVAEICGLGGESEATVDSDDSGEISTSSANSLLDAASEKMLPTSDVDASSKNESSLSTISIEFIFK